MEKYVSKIFPDNLGMFMVKMGILAVLMVWGLFTSINYFLQSRQLLELSYTMAVFWGLVLIGVFSLRWFYMYEGMIRYNRLLKRDRMRKFYAVLALFSFISATPCYLDPGNPFQDTAAYVTLICSFGSVVFAADLITEYFVPWRMRISFSERARVFFSKAFVFFLLGSGGAYISAQYFYKNNEELILVISTFYFFLVISVGHVMIMRINDWLKNKENWLIQDPNCSKKEEAKIDRILSTIITAWAIGYFLAFLAVMFSLAVFFGLGFYPKQFAIISLFSSPMVFLIGIDRMKGNVVLKKLFKL